jgi:hypothetical protein
VLQRQVKRVGSNYSVSLPDLQVRDFSVVLAWPTGIPAEWAIAGPRAYFAEPALRGKALNPLTGRPRQRLSRQGRLRPDRPPRWSALRPVSAGELAGHRT